MNKKATAALFYQELSKIYTNDLTATERLQATSRLLNMLFIDCTRSEKLQFTTLFARFAYAAHKYSLPKQLQFYLHTFRRRARAIPQRKDAEETALQKEFLLGAKVVAESIEALLDVTIPQDILVWLPANDFFKFSPVAIKAFLPFCKVVLLEDDPEANQFIASAEHQPAEQIRIQYNIAERNENFNPTIQKIKSYFQFPLVVNLIDVEIDEATRYRPKAFVIEPDYLVDVTAVANCFQSFGAVPLLYLLKKFLPFTYSKYLMIGNIANFFLDELMSNPAASFKEVFPRVFQLNPIIFATFDNRTIREIMQSSQKHFINLKKIILKDFSALGINTEHCFLEPSFYAEKYGLQGRLDVFYQNPKPDQSSAIIELKSGKAFMPNVYGISPAHFNQTLLYDLMLKSVFSQKLHLTNYILYSGLDLNHLRFAPATKAQQYEALQQRNQLVALEQNLIRINDQTEQADIFNKLSPEYFPKATGFLAKDLAFFQKVYVNMTTLERKYFRAYASFIAREHQLAKTGVQGLDNINGIASLWLNDFEEKQANFDIISHLRIKENLAATSELTITFEKTEDSNPLAKFRNGDIAVLYPFKDVNATVLSSQIFKCTIIEITEEFVSVRLRSQQFNNSIFEENPFWNLERDLLDSSFNGLYRGLFAFNLFPKHKKDLLLCLRAPAKVAPGTSLNVASELTEEQQGIFQKLLAAKDYFLLWGPPGTGKTSMMLKHFVAHLYDHSSEDILLLAYTNRAVDEICEAIESIRPSMQSAYLRIGSTYSTKEKFRKNLLNQKMESVQNRKGLVTLLGQHRIFVSTVSSISSKQGLLQLKKFNRVIIDEASQILEPILMGLLPQFEKFILIGDHKQLPAVVVQDHESSACADAEMHEIGITNLRNSLFERLFKQCQQNNWHWAYAQLSHQGRMHQEVMQFSNDYFYQGTLKILPNNISLSALQQQDLSYQIPEAASVLEKLLCQRRVLFLPSESDEQVSLKTNTYEAEMLSDLILAFQKIYQTNQLDFNANSLGIITPYRAQIAQIQQTLQAKEIAIDQLTIDTVERYQGGARDIILISLCTNDFRQLDTLISLSEEGVDRKLNVALTRARKHLIILGNPTILEQNEIYKNLIDLCKYDAAVV
ncbi:MAG: DEAD/DEAH box helicase [Saprospiraceae bacterium]